MLNRWYELQVNRQTNCKETVAWEQLLIKRCNHHITP